MRERQSELARERERDNLRMREREGGRREGGREGGRERERETHLFDSSSKRRSGSCSCMALPLPSFFALPPHTCLTCLNGCHSFQKLVLSSPSLCCPGDRGGVFNR